MRQLCVIAMLWCFNCCYATPSPISTQTIEEIKHSIVPVVCAYIDESHHFQVAFVAGSGFFVDTSGRFITAGHVVFDDWDAAMKKTHACEAAIYIPDHGWGKYENYIPMQFFWFTNCIRDKTVDLAVCQPTENPFISARVPRDNISVAVFDTDDHPDGTPIAFTGFPLENMAPITSIGFIGGGQFIPGNTIGHDLVIDKAAWPGASGSLVYLESGKVIGIILKGGRADASGIGVARNTAIIVDFLSKNPPAKKQDGSQKPATHF
jgi:hypothetical protein